VAVPAHTMTDTHDARDDRAPHPLRDIPFLVATVAVAVLVIGTIGPPLVGQGTFLASDQVTLAFPWRAYDDPAALNVGHHGPVTDTLDAIFPTRVAVADAARQGDVFGWNPYVSGGVPAAAESSNGSISPFAFPYLVLPDWFVPALIKLAQMAIAVGFTFLFCRRVGLDRVPAMFAGAAFAGSGFLVMWTNWQQPEVAALIAPLFWATERYLQGSSVARAAPIAVVVATMLLGNFPAVVGFALYALAGYVAIRLLLQSDAPVRRRIGVAAGAGAGLAVGALLVAAVMLPFAQRLGSLELSSRAQSGASSGGIATLVTAVAPKALGLSTAGAGHGFFGPRNQVESVSFIGMTSVLLAVVALCLPRPRRTPGGTRLALVVATLVLGVATFGGGPPLELLQHLPVFSDNFVGRSISVLAFMVAVLAGIGLQAVSERLAPGGLRGWIRVGAVVAGTLVVAGLALWHAYDLAGEHDLGGTVSRGLVLPAVIGVVAVATLFMVRSRRRRVAEGAAVGLVALLVVEALALALPLLPNEDEDLLFPGTPGIGFLTANIGHDRVAPQGLTLFGSATSLFPIRSTSGHAFTATTWKQALRAADPQAFAFSPTLSQLRAEPGVVASPMLDRLGVRWFAGVPLSLPVGRRVPGTLAEGSCRRPALLAQPTTVSIPVADGLRGVVVRTCVATTLPRTTTLEAVVTGPDGAVTTTRTPLPDAVDPIELPVAIPADTMAGNGDLTLTLGMGFSEGRSLALATDAQGEVAFDVIRPDDDGLRVAYAGDLLVYERTHALPRIRWAGRARVIDDPARRVHELSSGDVPDDVVVLSEPGPRGSGADADVEITVDAPTAVAMTVDAAGDGYAVVADAMQEDWVATVDGEPAGVVDADHAGVAVAVPEGRHVVELRYRPSGQRAGILISAVTAAGLAAAVALPPVVRRRRANRARLASPVLDDAAPSLPSG
jgi:hypothetical protein